MSLDPLQFRYLSHDQLFLINTLNTMYNDNHRTLQQIIYNNSVGFNNTSRIVQEIISSNNNIIDSITRTLTTVNRNNTIRLNNSQNNENSQTTQERQNNENTVPQQQTRIPRYINRRESVNNAGSNIFYELDNYMPRSRVVRLAREADNNLSNYLNNFFSPVQIYPTQTQIENATRIVRYGDIIRPNNISCPISLEPFRDDENVSLIRFCNHIFNTEQLNLWFQSNCRCPVCRYDIRNYTNQTINNNYQSIHGDYFNNNFINETNTNMSNNNTATTNIITDTTNNNIDISNNNIDISNNNIDISNNNTGLTNNMERLFTNTTNILTDYLLNNIQLNTDISGNNISDLLTNEITTILLTFPYNINNTRNNSDSQL